MKRDDIIRMARENGIVAFGGAVLKLCALVAAEKEQQMIRDGWRKCAERQRTTQYCGLLDAAVKAEREECAKLCNHVPGLSIDGAKRAAAAIRARGET